MKFKKGQNKLANSGRKPGVKNRFRITDIRKLLEDKHIDPIEEIMKLLPELKASEQVEVFKWLVTFIQPKMSEERYEKMLKNLEATEITVLSEEQTESLLKEI